MLVRYRFPGRRILDAVVDLPFALPTAVAGIALTALYAPNGWIGQFARRRSASSRLHAARHLRSRWSSSACPSWCAPCSRCWRKSTARSRRRRRRSAPAACRRSSRVILPLLAPAFLTGFALAFARAVGEYGSVIFIAGNIPFVSEIAPLLIVIRLEEFNYAGATAIATIMLLHLLPACCSSSTCSRPGAAGGMAMAHELTHRLPTASRLGRTACALRATTEAPRHARAC